MKKKNYRLRGGLIALAVWVVSLFAADLLLRYRPLVEPFSPSLDGGLLGSLSFICATILNIFVVFINNILYATIVVIHIPMYLGGVWIALSLDSNNPLSFIGVVLGFAIIVAEIAVYFGVGAFIGWLNGRAKTHRNQNAAPARFDANNW